jgi:hypothetical protein
MYLFKIGKKLNLRQYMRNRDPDIREWRPPFSQGAKIVEVLTCTGKNIADGVEALLGALFMSSNLYTTLKFISDIQLIPFEQARLLSAYKNEDYTFKLGSDLDAYGFAMNDTVSDIFKKYFTYHSLPENNHLAISDIHITRIYEDVLKLDKPAALFASRFDRSELKLNIDKIDEHDRLKALKQLVCPGVEKILGYEFANRNLLLQALTHR